MTLKQHKEKIESLSHIELARLWRFGGGRKEWFDSTHKASDYFYKRLFVHFGGFTPEISKEINK